MGKLFKRDFLKMNNIRFIPGMVRMRDNIFCLYSFYYAKEILFTSDRFYHYRKETNSVSFKYNDKIVEHFEKYFLKQKNLL
jgi:hypothetical protein